MSQLILESENESNLKLMQELAEKLNIHCQLILRKTKSELPLNDSNTQTEGTKALQLMEQYGLLGCMEGDGTLSENYKQHLWGNK